MNLSPTNFGSRRLIKDFMRGDEAAFERIYQRYRIPLLKYVRARSASLSEESAEEIVQEAFLRAFRFRETYKGDYAFTTWLWTIARNAMLDHLGKTPPELAAGAAPIASEDQAHPGADAEARLIRRSELRRLLPSFRRLPSGQRRALFLRIVRQLSYEEIALRMKTSLSAVKSVMNRARTSLIREEAEWKWIL